MLREEGIRTGGIAGVLDEERCPWLSPWFWYDEKALWSPGNLRIRPGVSNTESE